MYYTYSLCAITKFITQKGYYYSLEGHPEQSYYNTCIVHLNNMCSLKIKTDTKKRCFAETTLKSNVSNNSLDSITERHETLKSVIEYLELCMSLVENEESY